MPLHTFVLGEQRNAQAAVNGKGEIAIVYETHLDAAAGGLGETSIWLTVLDRARIAKPYKSPRHNREPMPPAVYRNLLAQADQWAKVDWEDYAESLPVSNRGDKRRIALAHTSNREVAWGRQRTGVITHSMLCLAANVGAQPSCPLPSRRKPETC